MRAVLIASLFLASATVAAFGCSASDNKLFQGTSSGFGGTGTGNSGTGNSGNGGTGATGTGGAGTGNSGLGGGITIDGGTTDDAGSGCSAASQLLYVMSTATGPNNEVDIYSFDPPSKVFTKVATTDCNAVGQANSMAIDRNLVAYLNFIGGIYKFDLTKKTGCQNSGISLPSGFTQVGMGYSSDAPGSSAETLYIDGIGGGGLAKIVNNAVVPIGKFANDPNISGQSAELTGTGDAKLFGYFTTSPNVRVAGLDKTNANVLSDDVLSGFPPPADWAFSFWGGDFYLYSSNGFSNSKVVHYTPSTKAVDLSYVPDVGFIIIGAGVSTCAPLKPPT